MLAIKSKIFQMAQKFAVSKQEKVKNYARVETKVNSAHGHTNDTNVIFQSQG